MPLFTVIIPTHDHADLLEQSVISVLAQTLTDIELMIIGDGVDDATRAAAAKLCARDARVRWFDFPKGERHGELHRHAVLAQIDSEFVAYQSDDDLWFPDHLETLAEVLVDADLAHTMAIEVGPDGALSGWLFDARLTADRECLAANGASFGLGVTAHRLAAYRRLVAGWQPAPSTTPTDLHMWRQFLQQPWCRYRSLAWPTQLHFSSVTRRRMSAQARHAEMMCWSQQLIDPLERDRLRRHVLPALTGVAYAQNETHYLRQQAIRQLLIRSSGIPCAAANVSMHPAPISPGAWLSCASGGDAHRFLISGFASPEHWGTWTVDSRALIALSLPQDFSGALILRLQVTAFLPPRRREARVDWRVDGGAWHYQVIGSEQVLDLDIPVRAGPLVLIELRMPDAVSPAAVGLSVDARRLGLGVIALRVDAQ